MIETRSRVGFNLGDKCPELTGAGVVKYVIKEVQDASQNASRPVVLFWIDESKLRQ